jgi:mRNA interferase RelE/StbE
LAWKINYTETALKQLRKLDRSTARRLIDFMAERIGPQTNPRAQGKALRGPEFSSLWRYRVGDYRILCDIQDGTLCVLVIEVGHRREIYRRP